MDFDLAWSCGSAGSGLQAAGTHVGSQLGSRIISSGSTLRSSGPWLTSGPAACGAGGGARAATLAFHDDDISGDELERRTGCRDLPCNTHSIVYNLKMYE